MTFGAVLYAQDIARVSAFYAALLDRPAVVNRGYVTVDSPSLHLAVVQVPADVAATIELADPPRRRTAVPVKIALPVPDIAALRATASRLGGAVDPVEREWRFGDATACDGHDPEGNVFQLRQTARSGDHGLPVVGPGVGPAEDGYC